MKYLLVFIFFLFIQPVYSEEKTVDWYKKSADQGNAVAQSQLGMMYYVGEGVSKDYKKASCWFKKSALQGIAPAQYNLGVMYSNGNGVSQDYKKAIY